MDEPTWEQVREKLEKLLEHTEKEEPYAVNFIRSLKGTLDGLPQDE